MKLENVELGMRVKSKGGMSDEGNIISVHLYGLVDVRWHYQDGTEISRNVDPKTLKKVEERPKCGSCGRELP